MKRIYLIFWLGLFSFFGFSQQLLDDYDGVGGLSYSTGGTWVVSSGVYEGQTGGVSAPEHSYASYDLEGTFGPGKWDLNTSSENAWYGWMDLNRASVVTGWGG
jgi:hypothetical protein